MVPVQICQNKHDREESIKKTLEKIELCLYIIPHYRTIYDEINNEMLTRRIIEVYKSIYRFVIESYKYYNSRRGRFQMTRLPIQKLTSYREISEVLGFSKVRYRGADQ
jgi:hypothetical protein